jgi:hypothetical protein
VHRYREQRFIFELDNDLPSIVYTPTNHTKRTHVVSSALDKMKICLKKYSTHLL